MVRVMAFAMPLAMLVACGGDKKDAGGGGSGGSAAGTGAAAGAALAVPAIGIDSPKRLNYAYGPGQKEYAKVVAAYKAKPRDWAAVKTAAEATIAKDADHLDARWALGEALANTGEAGKANEQLAMALAADWLRWGPGLAQDAELTAHLATAEGKALAELSAKLQPLVTAAIAKGPLVMGRRSSWKAPKPGTGYAATRGELYAYDAAAKRYVRVTHTDHTLAAALPSPTGEVLLVGFSQVEVPDPAKAKDAKAAKEAAPLLTKSWVSAWSPKELRETSAKAAIAKARFVWAGWGAGEQLVVMTAPAAGRWKPGTITTSVIDRGTGKLTKTKGAVIEGPHVYLSLDDVVDGARAKLPEALPSEVADKLAVAVGTDERGQPELATVAPSPGGTRIAFASATDPCEDADDAAKPSLYLGDAKTGAYKHVLTAASRFGVLWLDEDHLVYEDGSGGLRFYDAAAGRETGKLAERHGLGLRFLPPSAAPLCTTDPPVPETSDPAMDAIDEMMAPPPELDGLDEYGAATDPE